MKVEETRSNPDELRRVIVQRLGGNVDSKYWFGIDDGMKEGSWKWVDGNQVDKAEVGFASGQPNVGVKENCGATNGNMLLHDYPCSYKFEFVCEMKAC